MFSRQASKLLNADKKPRTTRDVDVLSKDSQMPKKSVRVDFYGWEKVVQQARSMEAVQPTVESRETSFSKPKHISERSPVSAAEFNRLSLSNTAHNADARFAHAMLVDLMSDHDEILVFPLYIPFRIPSTVCGEPVLSAATFDTTAYLFACFVTRTSDGRGLIVLDTCGELLVITRYERFNRFCEYVGRCICDAIGGRASAAAHELGNFMSHAFVCTPQASVFARERIGARMPWSASATTAVKTWSLEQAMPSLHTSTDVMRLREPIVCDEKEEDKTVMRFNRKVLSLFVSSRHELRGLVDVLDTASTACVYEVFAARTAAAYISCVRRDTTDAADKSTEEMLIRLMDRNSVERIIAPAEHALTHLDTTLKRHVCPTLESSALRWARFGYDAFVDRCALDASKWCEADRYPRANLPQPCDPIDAHRFDVETAVSVAVDMILERKRLMQEMEGLRHLNAEMARSVKTERERREETERKLQECRDMVAKLLVAKEQDDAARLEIATVSKSKNRPKPSPSPTSPQKSTLDKETQVCQLLQSELESTRARLKAVETKQLRAERDLTECTAELKAAAARCESLESLCDRQRDELRRFGRQTRELQAKIVSQSDEASIRETLLRDENTALRCRAEDAERQTRALEEKTTLLTQSRQEIVQNTEEQMERCKSELDWYRAHHADCAARSYEDDELDTDVEVNLALDDITASNAIPVSMPRRSLEGAKPWQTFYATETFEAQLHALRCEFFTTRDSMWEEQMRVNRFFDERLRNMESRT